MPNQAIPFLLRALMASRGNRQSNGVPQLLRQGSDAIVETPTLHGNVGHEPSQVDYSDGTLPPPIGNYGDTGGIGSVAPNTSGNIAFPRIDQGNIVKDSNPSVASTIGDAFTNYTPLGALLAVLTGGNSSWRPPIWQAAGSLANLFKDHSGNIAFPRDPNNVTITDTNTGAQVVPDAAGGGGGDNRSAGGVGSGLNSLGSALASFFGTGGPRLTQSRGNTSAFVPTQVHGYQPNAAFTAAMFDALGALGQGTGSLQGQALL